MQELTWQDNTKATQALDIMLYTKKHMFLTGKAGTGKSTLLSGFRTKANKRIVVLAPTGIAAINVKGETIHSFFRFGIDINPTKARIIASNIDDKYKAMYKALDTIVIDEISMVRADLLDSVDNYLKGARGSTAPFGGVQMIMIGDVFQLPPVVKREEKEYFSNYYQSPYFFDAQIMYDYEFTDNLEYIELQKIYRQTDDNFIQILNAVRNNTITDAEIKELNKRVNRFVRTDKNSVYIVTTNRQADYINAKKLEELPGLVCSFKGIIAGDFDKKLLPTNEELQLKKGAQIMFLNNDMQGRWANGTIGHITEIAGDIITVKLNDGRIVDVEKYAWEICKSRLSEDGDSLEQYKTGSFIQYPLKLAFAVTIHKAQGCTFDKVIIDLGFGSFAHGQTYVALSRCTNLNGITLRKAIRKEDILLDEKVVDFMAHFITN